MLQFILKFIATSVAVVLLVYAVAVWSQDTDEPLPPVRRAALLGAVVGTLTFLGAVAWWAWVKPPG